MIVKCLYGVRNTIITGLMLTISIGKSSSPFRLNGVGQVHSSEFSAMPLSPDPLAQLGLAKTDVHAGAVTADGSGVK